MPVYMLTGSIPGGPAPASLPVKATRQRKLFIIYITNAKRLLESCTTVKLYSSMTFEYTTIALAKGFSQFQFLT